MTTGKVSIELLGSHRWYAGPMPSRIKYSWPFTDSVCQPRINADQTRIDLITQASWTLLLMPKLRCFHVSKPWQYLRLIRGYFLFANTYRYADWITTKNQQISLLRSLRIGLFMNFHLKSVSQFPYTHYQFESGSCVVWKNQNLSLA